MGFAERLSESCVASDLGAKEGKIKSVEHVAALSGATSLGSDMMRARDYDANALRRAILVLARTVRQEMRLGMGPAENLARCAIFEVLHWQCRACNGASEHITGGVRKTCAKCEGTGIHRWRDTDRAKESGYPLDTWHLWSNKYEKVIAMARKHDSQTIGLAHKKMGY